MSMHSYKQHKMIFNAITVLTVLVQGTFSQSILLSLGHNQRNFFGEANSRESLLNTPMDEQPNYTNTISNTQLVERDDLDDNNTTIIVINSTVREQSNELSQTAMDIITIVWYVATFLALAAFFLLLACSDRRCSTEGRNTLESDRPIPPPTPSPSYSEFAPPSYETVIKMQHDAKTSIFVIPFATLDVAGNKNFSTTNNSNNANNVLTPQTPTTPAINLYTVNELKKFGC